MESWMPLFVKHQGHEINDNVVCQDNKSAVLSEKNGRSSARKRNRASNTCHFNIADNAQKGNVIIKHCSTDKNIGDCMSKALQGIKFDKFCNCIVGFDEKPPQGVTCIVTSTTHLHWWSMRWMHIEFKLWLQIDMKLQNAQHEDKIKWTWKECQCHQNCIWQQQRSWNLTLFSVSNALGCTMVQNRMRNVRRKHKQGSDMKVLDIEGLILTGVCWTHLSYCWHKMACMHYEKLL